MVGFCVNDYEQVITMYSIYIYVRVSYGKKEVE